MSANIDPVTGLPDLTSDVYQIPLNTDSLPYKDLQAETRIPRQPLLPDDIIPTVALLTGLDSDNTGQVVHTDDNHAAKVYVVNQPSSGGGGGNGPYTVKNYILSRSTTGFGDDNLDSIGPLSKPIRGLTFSYAFGVGSVAPGQAVGYVTPFIVQNSGSGFFLGSIAILIGPDGTIYKGAGEVTMSFDGGLIIDDAEDDGGGNMFVKLRSINVGGGNLNLHIWQDA